MTANICVISCHANTASMPEALRGEVSVVGNNVRGLVGQGHRVTWITSSEIIEVCTHDAAFILTSEDDLPATCRYVLPCQPCRLAGAPVLAVERNVWRDTALHTRLFSFLCLLQRELKWDFVHVWGDLAAVFMSVFTAQFLGIPAVVSYDDGLIASKGRQPFVWRWINRHVALASVCCETDRQRLLAVSELPAENIRVVDAGHLGTEILYAELTSAQASSPHRGSGLADNSTSDRRRRG